LDARAALGPLGRKLPHLLGQAQAEAAARFPVAICTWRTGRESAATSHSKYSAIINGNTKFFAARFSIQPVTELSKKRHRRSSAQLRSRISERLRVALKSIGYTNAGRRVP